MQPKSKLSAIACAISLAGILTVVGCNARESAETVSASSAEPGAARVPAVRTVEAVTRPIAASVQVTGSFVAKETSDVAPEAAGRVVETFVNVGDFVKEGQVIVRFEDRDAQLRLEQAKASEQQAEALLRQAQSRIGLDEGRNFNPDNVPEVLSAKADAQRYENLIKTGDVSRSAYERERTQAETAEAQANSARQMYEAALNSARQNYQGVLTAQASLAAAHAQTALAQKAVQDTVVRAPFPGFISARPVAAGQYVALTSKIATLLRITPIKLDLQVPESNAPQLRLGVTVEANAPGFPGRVFQGKVTALNPAVDPNSRTFSVEAEFPNLDVALKPGMFGTARIFLTGATDGIFIPTEAILTDPTTNSSQVFFVRDGKARVAVVQLGAKDGGVTQILSGLSAGALVATDHLQDLYDGETVQTAPARHAAASAKQGN